MAAGDQPGFDVDAYIDALERYRITVLTAVPTMFARIIKDPLKLQGRDFSAPSGSCWVRPDDAGPAPAHPARLARCP
jgi:acyl-CoA synthetase (AMP-forming)/AMP-acid ligase II